ncbi:MAG: putative membrane protein YhhN [Flavobacteriaceae bacterium]|jgi:uncharacterized membrane protein YhhN|uniref:lysoplasmalogenase n=1 Tax=Candidatus Marifrigoribacter sp. Uisw_064 TaxID=3230970 RepID=UPI003AE511DB
MKLKVWSILIIISALSAIVFQYSETLEYYNYAKALTTILIVLVPILFSKTSSKKYKNLIIIGLFFCLIGDVFLLDNAYFIAGLASFLVGHLIFTYAFLSLKRFQKKYGIFAILLFIGLSYFYYLKPSLGEITIPVGVYILVIVLMNWQALSLYALEKNKVHLMICIGAILFLISDSILAFDKFKESFSFAGVLILTTYWTAIYMFAYSTISINKK